MGLTVMMTAELEDRYTDSRCSPHDTAFLTDAIILQRYLELDSRLQRVMTVVKIRGSAHSKDFRVYVITAAGSVVGEPSLTPKDCSLEGGSTRHRRPRPGLRTAKVTKHEICSGAAFEKNLPSKGDNGSS